jgi:hypothetical protein
MKQLGLANALWNDDILEDEPVPLALLKLSLPLWPLDWFCEVLLAAQRSGLIHLEPAQDLAHASLVVKDREGRCMGYASRVSPAVPA